MRTPPARRESEQRALRMRRPICDSEPAAAESTRSPAHPLSPASALAALTARASAPASRRLRLQWIHTLAQVPDDDEEEFEGEGDEPESEARARR